MNWRYVGTGVLFAVLWSSAGTAGKFGIRSVEPLVLFTIRFLSAGILMLLYSHGLSRDSYPKSSEWKPLLIFGFFNTTLYLGVFIVALQYITAGITALGIAINPLIISVMSSYMLGRKVSKDEWISIVIGITGVVVAAWPLLISEEVLPGGVLMLFICMVAYSFGSVYYGTINWGISRLTINGWQVFFGGLMLIPFAWLMHKGENQFDRLFWISEAWLIFPVSIVSVQLWLVLLKKDAVRASLWLFLCPISGLIISSIFLGEQISSFTIAGTVMVLGSLYLGQRQKWSGALEKK